MTQPTQTTDSILNQILDKINAKGFKSLTPEELTTLDKISKGESLTIYMEVYADPNDPREINQKPVITLVDRFNQALKLSGYQKDFRKIFGANFTTRGRVTGWYIEKDFIAYLEYNDKRTDLIFDNIAEKLSIEEFNEMISNIIIYIESEFKLKYTNDKDIVDQASRKYKLNPTFIEFILYK